MARPAMVLAVIAMAASMATGTAAVGCLDSAGESVDWWIALKVDSAPCHALIAPAALHSTLDSVR